VARRITISQIEHRLFRFVARNWRGQPLVSRQAVVSLIGATTSTAGLKVYAELDENLYERAIKITDAQLPAVSLTPDGCAGHIGAGVGAWGNAGRTELR
jgi:hypothetical protein